ncbi:NAD(P)H-binding protein [Dongia sp.]|uniref:NmrA family NAD(P)-binding protein n=1 Tax=Dongia sp. TaxID=1977262 RepID=UPI0035AEF9D7
MNRHHPILVIGGTGKTGRRVAAKLAAAGHVVRATSRSGPFVFDWNDPAGWAAILQGVQAAYVTYQPDLAVPGSEAAIAAFTKQAAVAGIRHLVLLSGRGEPEAAACEAIVQGSGLHWTILRANWFMQNFSETFFVEGIRAGELALPAVDIPEPFIDADDIADVAVAALTDIGHTGQVYELSGPRALTFAEAVAEIAAATGREIRFSPVPIDAFAEGLRAYGLPEDMIALVRYLFTTVLDGRNSETRDGVLRALGRAPRDFADYAQGAAGVWAPALRAAQG